MYVYINFSMKYINIYTDIHILYINRSHRHKYLCMRVCLCVCEWVVGVYIIIIRNMYVNIYVDMCVHVNINVNKMLLS